jgi:hypothetical protein
MLFYSFWIHTFCGDWCVSTVVKFANPVPEAGVSVPELNLAGEGLSGL